MNRSTQSRRRNPRQTATPAHRRESEKLPPQLPHPECAANSPKRRTTDRWPTPERQTRGAEKSTTSPARTPHPAPSSPPANASPPPATPLTTGHWPRRLRSPKSNPDDIATTVEIAQKQVG